MIAFHFCKKHNISFEQLCLLYEYLFIDKSLTPNKIINKDDIPILEENLNNADFNNYANYFIKAKSIIVTKARTLLEKMNVDTKLNEQEYIKIINASYVIMNFSMYNKMKGELKTILNFELPVEQKGALLLKYFEEQKRIKEEEDRKFHKKNKNTINNNDSKIFVDQFIYHNNPYRGQYGDDEQEIAAYWNTE